nr:uncharacterized protein LOC112040993 [Quercus suber]
MDQCVLRTSLQLHNFGRRFYGCRHWKPGSDEHCKSFKWLDGIPCRRGAETAPIVIAKFTRLQAEAAMAKNNEMEARAMIANLIHMERVAKRSAEKARASLRMANARARKYQIALLMRGAETAPIVIAKFTRLQAEAAMAKNNEMEARAMIANLIHMERVAKRSAEKARASLRMANARARRLDYDKCVFHDSEFGLVDYGNVL